MLVAAGIDQLNGDSYPVAGALNRAFQDSAHTQFIAYLTQILDGIAILHDRGSRDHFESADFSQLGQQVVMHSIRKIDVVRVSAAMSKGQDRNGVPGVRGLIGISCTALALTGC